MAQSSVVFIDDSATMREVIKIAFRRENIDVVTFPDANSALLQIEKQRPDVVITDVIMPDRDGYEVCQHIKAHAQLAAIPVILMSGVVNRTVAEKAFAVKATELIRKPFQPQDLIARVKALLQPKDAPIASSASAAAALSNIFSAPQTQRKQVSPVTQMSEAAAAISHTGPSRAPAPMVAAASPAAAFTPPAQLASEPRALASVPRRPTVLSGSTDIAKLKIEIMRLEGLAKKLQSELAAEREYARALEAHIKTLQEAG